MLLHRTFTNRFEIKYLVDTHRLETVRRELSSMLAADPNAGPDGAYYNLSIYFDSPSYRFYSEKHEGLLKRLKPRLRTHLPTIGAEPGELFLELKGRHDRTVQKQRSPISMGMAREMLSGGMPSAHSDVASASILTDFEYMARRFDLRPTVTVLYRRTPFHLPMHPNVRLTFDAAIMGSLNTALDSDRTKFSYVIPPTQSLIELKYNDDIPSWLVHRLNRLGLVQVTFSKFAVALESCFERFQIRLS